MIYFSNLSEMDTKEKDNGTTVRTKEQLKAAINRKEFPIRGVGEAAQMLIKKKKKAKRAKIAGGLIALAGIAALPFTAGMSSTAVAAGLTIGGGGIVISTAELAILVGGGVATLGVLKGRKVQLHADGSVLIE